MSAQFYINISKS